MNYINYIKFRHRLRDGELDHGHEAADVRVRGVADGLHRAQPQRHHRRPRRSKAHGRGGRAH